MKFIAMLRSSFSDDRFSYKYYSYCILITLIGLVCLYIEAISEGLFAPVIHIDGAYQTYNGLARLHQGQKIGEDFFVYLGGGVYQLLYPFYSLVFTPTPSGATSAAYSATYLAIFALFYIALWSSHHVKRPFIYAVFLFALLYAFEITLMEKALATSNSLRTVRDFSAILCCLVLLLTFKWEKQKKLLLLSFTLGAVALFSPVSSATALIIFGGYIFFQSLDWNMSNLKNGNFYKLAALCSASFFLGFISISLLSGSTSGMISQLTYQLSDILGNQKWFFSPYVVLSVSNYYLRIFSWMIVFGAFLIFYKMRIQNIKLTPVILLVLAFLLIGLITSLGGHFYKGYFRKFELVMLLAAISLVIDLAIEEIKKLESTQPALMFKARSLLRIKFTDTVLPLLLIFGLFSYATVLFLKYQDKLDELKADQNLIFVQELGGFVHNGYAELVKFSRTIKAPLIEEYSGIPSAISGHIPSQKVDSVIHALGQQRKELEQSLKNHSGLITITHPDYDHWYHWNLQQSWYFYKHLYLNYDPVFSTHSLVFFEKRKTKRLAALVPCVVDSKTKSIIVNENIPGFYSVLLNYKYDGGRNSYLLLETGLPENPAGKDVSLPPHLNSFLFPVRNHPNHKFKFFSRPSKNVESLTLFDCHAQDFSSFWTEYPKTINP